MIRGGGWRSVPFVSVVLSVLCLCGYWPTITGCDKARRAELQIKAQSQSQKAEGRRQITGERGGGFVGLYVWSTR